MADIGRPTDYSQEIVSKICSEIAEGKSLRAVCEIEGMPDKSTVFVWLREHKEFQDQYARATEERTEALSEELMDLGDEAVELAQTVDAKASSAVVQAVKLKADNIKWTMSKMKPKKYGDKIDMTTNGKDIPQPILGYVQSSIGNTQNTIIDQTNQSSTRGDISE